MDDDSDWFDHSEGREPVLTIHSKNTCCLITDHFANDSLEVRYEPNHPVGEIIPATVTMEWHDGSPVIGYKLAVLISLARATPLLTTPHPHYGCEAYRYTIHYAGEFVPEYGPYHGRQLLA